MASKSGPVQGGYRIGSAYIDINPSMDIAAFQAALRQAEMAGQESQKRYGMKAETAAKHLAGVIAEVEKALTAKLGTELDKRVRDQMKASDVLKGIKRSEAEASARYVELGLKEFTAAEKAKTAAAEKERLAREKRQAAYEKYVRTSNARIATAEQKDIAASAKEVRAGIAAKEKKQAEFEKYVKASNARIAAAEQKEIAESAKAVAAAEKAKADAHARSVKLRETQIKSLSALVIRQAQIEATEQTKAARAAQAAYTAAHNTRKAQILSTMNSLRAESVAAVQSQMAQAAAARDAAKQTIKANAEATRALQANANKASKSWTKAMYTAGGKINAIGASTAEFGRNIQRNVTTPLLTAAAAMSTMGISAADSIMRAQTALQGMNVTPAAATKQIDTLREYGTQTPYVVGDMLTYAAQYTRSGMSHNMSSAKASKRATNLVMSIGDLAAYAGITDPEMVKRAMVAVGNIQESDRAGIRNVRTLAESAGLDVQQLAQLLGFKDRPLTEKELADQEKMKKKRGVEWKAPKISSAASQMRSWMQDAKITGGVPGEVIVDAILDQAKKVAGTGTSNSAAVKQGGATISARLSNMWESSKYGLSNLFISPTGKNGQYKYTGAGAALMGTEKDVYKPVYDKATRTWSQEKTGEKRLQGGLLEKVSSLGPVLQGFSSKMVEGLFKSLTIVAGWAEKTAFFLKDNPALTDMIVQAGKWAAILGGGAIVLGSVIKLLGFIAKFASPLLGLTKGLLKVGRAGVKTAGQATGIGTKTDAEKEAKSIRQQAKQQAREEERAARRASRQLDGPADRREARREASRRAKRTRLAGESRAQRVERQGLLETNARDRYQQRRANLNGGDNRSIGRRAWDGIRGKNSQVEEIQVNTDRAQASIQALDAKIEGLKEKIQRFRGENFDELADSLAGQDSSVKAKAEAAERAIKAADLAATNLKGLKFSALSDEFNRLTGDNNGFKDAVQRVASEVSTLNGKGLGDLDGELNESKSKSDALGSALASVAKNVGQVDDSNVSHLKARVDNLKDAAKDAADKVGGDGDSLNGRIGKLNGLKTGTVVGQINNLKDALNDASGKAKTLNDHLNNISANAPASGGGSSKSNKKNTHSALGGVLPGYTPGQDVHHFTSPTGGSLHLSGGEAVMRPEWTAAVGVDFVNRMNSIARAKGAAGVQNEMRFANGGVLEKLGLQGLVDAAKNYNVTPEARGALATMTMDSSSRALGGNVQKGILGAGTDSSHFVGKNFAAKFDGIYEFMTDGAWELLRKAKVPDGWTQLIGTIAGAVTPVTTGYFKDDVWKGEGNILERGARYLDDVFSWKTLKDVAGNLVGGVWDSIKSLASGASSLITDPIGFVQDGVEGVWELTRQQYTGIIDMVKTMRDVWNSPKDYADQVIADTYSTAKESLPNLEGLFDFSGDGLSSKKKPDITDDIEHLLTIPGPGDAVTRWTPQVKMVLSQLGLPMSDLDLVLHRIQVESGGNPSAINLWDSNAKAGYPSQGLMQTIPQTFAAYAGPYKSRGITDPLASIYAGLNYAVNRYGAGWRKALSGIQGYATGTDGAARGWAWVGEEGPELVNFKGGETVLNHQDSILAGSPVKRGYASGTASLTRTTGIAADAFKGVSTLNSAVSKLYSIIKQAFTSGRIGSGTSNSLNKWLDKQNKSLQTLVKDRTTLATKLKDANTALAKVKADETEMATSIADKAKSERSLTGVFNSDGVSVSSAISGLKERLTAIKTFQSNISQLAQRGFSKEIIAEVAQAGLAEGGAMAKELLNATEAQVTEFNSTYAAFDSASTSLGKSVATTYYATGKKAAQALVDGLTAQDDALKKKIAGIADTIISTLKKKLKFSSKTPVDSSLATLLTWLTGQSQSVKGGGKVSSKEKKTVRTTTTYSTDSEGRKVTTVTTTTTDPAKGTTTTVTKRTVGGKTTTSTKVSTTKGYAAGTRSAARGLAFVGERGTELVDFKGGERVYNNRETADLLGPRYEIHIHEAKSEDTTQAVLRAMKYAETMAAL